jgi:hypothetical protein
MLKQKGFSPILIIILLFVIAAVVVGYLYKGKVVNLNKSASPVPTPITATDGRPELAIEDARNKFPANNYKGKLIGDDYLASYSFVNAALNHDAPVETRTYTNKEYGISIDLPYNQSWGTKDFKPVLADEINIPSGFEVAFGPVNGNCDGDCWWTREYALFVDRYQPIAEFIKDLDSQIGAAGAPYTLTGYTKEKVNERMY